MRHFFHLLTILLFATPLAAQAGADLHLEAAVYTTTDGTEIKAKTGYLTVKENRDDPASADIKLPFVRLKSTAAQAAAPLVYLEGGPGSSCTWMAGDPRALDRWAPLLALNDVILVDQRGTGGAGRRLTYINFAGPPADAFVTREAAKTYLTGMTTMARAAWAEAGVDHRGYTTLASAADLDDLRLAMGLDQISLLGFSYGTQLGQAYMKYYGDHVSKAILVGVEGLDETFKLPGRMDAQLRKLSALVAADPELSGEIPDLVALYLRVSQKLAAEPVEVEVSDPLSGQPLKLLIGKYGLDHILMLDMGDATDLPVIPRLLYEIDRGEYGALAWFAGKRVGGLYGIHAMAATMDVASGLSPARRALIAEKAETSLFGDLLCGHLLWMGDGLDAPDLGPEYRAAFTSTIPTLLLSGSLDMNTPPEQAERLRWNLTNARHLVVRNAGHEQILTNKDAQRAIGLFLAGQPLDGITPEEPALTFIPLTGQGKAVWHPAVSAR